MVLRWRRGSTINQMKLREWFGRRSGRGAWNGWPESAYRQAPYQQRLLAVQDHLAAALNAAPAGPVNLISICAGDGRDVIGVLQSHSRRGDVTSWLVEQDGQSVADGFEHAARAGLQNSIHFVHGDATVYETYADIAPANVVLLCGVWGHVPISERPDLVRALAAVCRPTGSVVWTRGVSKGIRRLHEIQAQFAKPAWEQVRVSVVGNGHWAIATQRFNGPPAELPRRGQIFHFRTGAGAR